MAGSVLNWTFSFQINISAKLKISASKSATSPSCITLADIIDIQNRIQNLNLRINENKNPFYYYSIYIIL
jgi:hypothetical protein